VISEQGALVPLDAVVIWPAVWPAGAAEAPEFELEELVLEHPAHQASRARLNHSKNRE
jgi:hypothetical protein